MDTRCRFNLVIAFWLLAFSAFGQNQRAQSFTGTVGVTGAVVTVSGGATFNWGNTLLVDAVNGVNATAARANGAKPFKDPFAAKNAASAGDTIILRRGIYNTNDLWKGGVTWWFDDGAEVQFTDIGGNGRGIWDDRGDPGTTNIVDGYGTFRHMQTAFTGNIRGLVTLSSSASRLHLRARRLEVGGGLGLNSAAIHMTNGTLFATLDEIIDVGVAGVDFNSAIYFRNGYADIQANYINANGHIVFAQELAGSTGSLLVNGTKWTQPTDVGHAGIKVDAASAGTVNSNFYVSANVFKLETDGPCFSGNIGTVHLVANEIRSVGGSVGYNLFQVASTCDLYTRSTKLVQPHTSGHYLFWTDTTYTGHSTVDARDWQQSSSDPAIWIQGAGTVDIFPAYVRTANGRGLQMDGTGTTRLKGVRIDTSATDNANNNPVVIIAASTGLVLENCALQAPPLATSIRGTNTITIAGTLQVNTPPDATMNLTRGGLLMINGAMVVPPTTNSTSPFILPVTTNSFQRSSSLTNGTVTFVGTPVDGIVLYWEYINTSATNQPIGIPSSIPLQVQGNAAITSYTCAANAVTTFRWERVSGAWQVSIVGPDLPVTYSILTNSYNGFNVFLDLSKNTMQFLTVTNNFTLILTNQSMGQKVGLTMYNITATNCTITLPSVQIYGSGISNVVVAAKRLKTAWESQDTQVTNVSAAFAQQKN